MNREQLDKSIRYGHRCCTFTPNVCRALDKILAREDADKWWGWFLDAVNQWLDDDPSLTISQAVDKAIKYG